MKKLPPPESQMQEVLFELINRFEIDRKTMMLSCGIMNLTARISDLRAKGINILTNKIETVNKFGRDISYAKYSIINKSQAIKVYYLMKENQSS